MSCRVRTFCFLTFALRIGQMFSMGLKSGELSGHGRTWIPWSVNHFLTNFDVWQGAKSCCKINQFDGNQTQDCGTRLDCSILMYWSLFIEPSTTANLDVPWTDMHPQIMTLMGNLNFGAKCSGFRVSSLNFLTNWKDSGWTLIWTSSEKITCKN